MDMTAIENLTAELEGFDKEIEGLCQKAAEEKAKIDEKYKGKISAKRTARAEKAKMLTEFRDRLNAVIGKNRVVTTPAPGTVRQPAVKVPEELVREVFEAVRAVPRKEGRAQCTAKMLRETFTSRKDLPDHKIQAALLELRNSNHVCTEGEKAGMRYFVPDDVTSWARPVAASTTDSAAA